MSENNWQEAIYLIILIVMMLSAVFSRQDLNWRKIIKYLIIWGGIGFLVIALYAYRFEFGDFKNRFVSEINPTSPKINAQKQIILNIAQDGHFYTRLKINNVEVLFMVDTGASDMMLNISDAKKIGIDVSKLVFNRPYQTANGRSFGAIINLKEVDIAGIKFNNVRASVNDADMGVNLLGMSFLRRFSKYEFFQDRLILTPFQISDYN
ncbi:hypothetical protein LBMAG18_07690 [Alphaproteobacteria bacterium]|nr:hypothetical protein LBMAG18_07690 [Alphaproteobacteria bacterium]